MTETNLLHPGDQFPALAVALPVATLFACPMT
jgi:hypothetical protein